MIFFSPSKINLFLRVLRKRSDGYHEIASLLQATTLGDYLTFSFASRDELVCTNAKLPCDASNLISKALVLFRRKTGKDFRVKIRLDKRIPMEAGLGGGSSNAATTLWALNQLCGSPISTEQLQNWSQDLGSDVPFFFSQGLSYCTGRGECVDNLPPLSLPSFEILKPFEGLSSTAIYNHLDLSRCSKQNPEDLLSSFFSKKNLYINDLEGVACSLCP